ncbi:MAG: hypothetical protein OEZ24_04955, partial [Candidatus Bathyarchaeota archaeon]|nr:hypothetical protein [Candidatus Bathyarchaeota archaeon]
IVWVWGKNYTFFFFFCYVLLCSVLCALYTLLYSALPYSAQKVPYYKKRKDGRLVEIYLGYFFHSK